MASCTACCLSLMQHWERVAPSGPKLPMKRSRHAATTFTPLQPHQQPILVILGGVSSADVWMCDLKSGRWTEVGFVCEKVVTNTRDTLTIELSN